MKEVQFDGTYMTLTTEQVGDDRIERVSLPDSAHTFIVTEKKLIRLVVEHRLGQTDTKIKLQAGIVEKDESPLETAKRELREELGIAAGSWQSLFVLEAQGAVNHAQHYFLAKDISIISDQTDGEILGTKDFTSDDLYARAMDGEFSPVTQAAIARFLHLINIGVVTV